MTPVPFDLPLRPDEAGELAALIFQHAEGKPLSDDLRNRLAARAATLKLETVRPYLGSLECDPVHRSTYFVAVDGRNGTPLLLHIALATSPANALYPKALLIGRMRRPGGPEIVVNASPFSPADRDNVRRFATEINQSFLPRPQGAQPAIAVGNRHPEISLAAAFDAFRAIQKRTGRNFASTVRLSASRESATDGAIAARDGEDPLAPGHTRVSLPHLYHTGLWAAIRAGWREGYNAEADGIAAGGATPDETARTLESAQEIIRHAAGFTRFSTDTSRLVHLEADPRHPDPWSDAAVEEKLDSILDPEERAWVLDEFSRPMAMGEAQYDFAPREIRRLAVKLGASLLLHERLYDCIRRAGSGRKPWRGFDFEPSFGESATLTDPKELIFCLQWLKSRGRPAQLAAPNIGFEERRPYPETFDELRGYAEGRMWPELVERTGRDFDGKPLAELAARLTGLAAVARHFQGILSIRSGSGKQAEALDIIARATSGRVNYKISGELQLQLLDVLSEQPGDSPWRALYERMVRRAEELAARGAFGPESALAARHRALGPCLGDALGGRVDGNPFLVRWLGNVAGSRDENGPGGDRRFFQDKLAELPADLSAEARRRNTRYIDWLAEHLVG